MGRRRNVLNAFSLLYLAVVAIWTVVMRVAEFNWLATLLLYAPQHIWLPVPTFLLLLALVRRNRRAAGWNLVSLVLVSVALMGFRLPIWRTGVEPGIALRVMTYNVHHGAKGLDNIAHTVRGLSPDIICLQEANPGSWNSDLPKQMDSLMPGWHVARFRELATLSRYPIVSQRVHRMQPETGRVVLETVMDVEGRRLVVLNAHLSTSTTGSLVHRSVGLSRYMANAVATRSFQVAAIGRVVSDTKGAVIVTGDLNNPPRGVLYHRMLRRLGDAFGLGGLGFGYTYPTRMPVLRVDYVFVNEKLGVRRCFVPDVRSSDHRPVVADLIILGSDAEDR